MIYVFYFFIIEPRGFGFVTFEDISSVHAVLAVNEHYIDGKMVECKQAVPKDPTIT